MHYRKTGTKGITDGSNKVEVRSNPDVEHDMPIEPGQITVLLKHIQDGEESAVETLYPLVYEELRNIAHHRLVKHRPGDTLNTTALVHEAYLKLVKQEDASPNDRSHFFALASRAMRFIIVDYARAKTASKRGGEGYDVPLSNLQLGTESKAFELVALDQALETLMARSERLGKLVEYKFFGGMTYAEIASCTGLSIPTLKRDWQRARTWLYQLMQE